jgi:hypothetical protein
MNHEAKLKPYSPSTFFANGALAQSPVDGTVDRSSLVSSHGSYVSDDGKKDGVFVTEIPLPLSMKLLRRGQNRFQVYCAPCHGDLAEGNGMIVQHGFLAPPSFHTEEMRSKPAGFYFDVITHGYGAMFSYGDRLAPEDRWAVVSYIRALQLSRRVKFEALNDAEKHELAGQ